MNLLPLRGVRINWDAVSARSYLQDIPALHFDQLTFTAPVTCLCGENGSGKSTLLEALALALGMNPEGGGRNYRFATYDSHSELHQAMQLVRGPVVPKGAYFLRAESFYNVASKAEDYRQSGLGTTSEEDFYARYGGRALHKQSHGESFLHLLQGEFKPGGLYLLDEPEAALSPQRQLTLLYELHRLAQQGAQFIMATHSPLLLGTPGAAILSFDGGAVHPIQYEDTDSYRITQMFITRRDSFLRQLLEE